MFDIPTVGCRDPVTERHFRRSPQRVDVHAIKEFAWRSIRLRPIPVNLSRLSHRLSHHDRQFFESDLRFLAQLLLGMAGIADQEIDFCRPIVPGIDFDIPLLIKPSMPKRYIVHDVCVTLQSTVGHNHVEIQIILQTVPMENHVERIRAIIGGNNDGSLHFF